MFACSASSLAWPAQHQTVVCDRCQHKHDAHVYMAVVVVALSLCLLFVLLMTDIVIITDDAILLLDADNGSS